MKKIIFLLLCTVSIYGQTLQNPTYGIVTEKNNASDNTPTYFVTQEVDGVHKKTPAALIAKTAAVDAVNAALTPESSRLDPAFKWIWTWGDSLTAGAGAGGITYPSSLANITNYPVENRGVGGESSTQIKDRFIAEPAHYNKSVIIWAGRNNYTTPTTVKADIATMVSTLGHTRYLVLSILNADVTSEWLGGLDYNTIITLNNDLKAIYGERYIDVRAHLVSLHNNSAQDLIDFSHDIPPASLRSDHIHLNAAGYTKIAEFLNSKLGILLNQTSFLQAKDIDYYTMTTFAPVSTNYIPYLSNNGKSVTNSNIYYTGTDVGIGTTTPGAKLDVNGDIRVADNGQLAFGWGYAGVTGNSSTQSVGLFSWNGAGTTERLRATNSGAILINTLTDNGVDKLQVSGSISASNYTGSATLTGTPLAPTATAGTNTTQIATTAFVLANAGGTPQDLQSIINTGGYAELDGGNSYTYFLDDGGIESTTFISDGAGTSAQSSLNTGNFALRAYSSTRKAYIEGYNATGIKITNGGSTFSTILSFDESSVESSIKIPAKTIAGTYTLVVNPNTPYTVSTLPTGQLNDIAVVTDALAPTYLGTLIGGGSVVTPVWHNGLTWVSR